MFYIKFTTKVNGEYTWHDLPGKYDSFETANAASESLRIQLGCLTHIERVAMSAELESYISSVQSTLAFLRACDGTADGTADDDATNVLNWLHEIVHNTTKAIETVQKSNAAFKRSARVDLC
jgi:hypothetical protein